MFRVAVREIEAWALADSRSLVKYFGVSSGAIPKNVDGLADPKAELLNVIRTSKRKEILEGCLPDAKAYSPTGPDYNHHLCTYFSAHWSPVIASKQSNSLRRAVSRLSVWR
jgi:hypothetical protein